eukprot:CAMPEP_0119120920 /NCGR_PEP_ID=MMETSP1310-20130426/1761_1 /TAXON_ID=464262 /ORGANISM="Genus nov. species nov., Strain RCC2339" /LENGTH=350 /DNA_ID=CAMNT_0007110437 /DNA_START=73 /DNA_END=1122 /DNA_ORIENTATION=-
MFRLVAPPSHGACRGLLGLADTATTGDGASGPGPRSVAEAAPLSARRPSDEGEQEVLAVEDHPDEPVELDQPPLRVPVPVQLGCVVRQRRGQHRVSHHHRARLEDLGHGQREVHRRPVVAHEHPHGRERHGLGAPRRRQRADPGEPVPLGVGQVLGDGDDCREDGDEARDERDVRAPAEGQAQRRPHRVVHPEVQQEAPDGGDNEEGRHGEALEPQRGHRVRGAEEQAEGIQGGDEGPEAGGQGEPSGRQGGAQAPGGGRRQLPRRHGQERLVHLVDVHVVDLVDAHDEAVAAQQCEDPEQGFGQQRPVDRPWGLQQRPRCHRRRAQDGPPDGVRPEELPEGLQEPVRLA